MLLLDVVLVLVGGFLAGRLAELARLPALLGMLLYGIAIGPFGLAVLSEEFVAQSPTVSVVALVTVIIASFFAIDLAVLRRDARTIVLVGVIPGLIEGFTIMVAAVALLDFTWVQGAILGFTLAVVSPAVVVPTMIRLKDAGWGMDKDIPVLVLAATNLDGLVAVILWLVFVTIETGGGDIAEVSTVAISEILLGAIWAWYSAASRHCWPTGPLAGPPPGYAPSYCSPQAWPCSSPARCCPSMAPSPYWPSGSRWSTPPTLNSHR